ncbi:MULTISPECIES: 23S rRNA pseudouridine(1911/1915/1917) synthase RluD [Shewanella]|jgi:23S rRNA pseudouridine1911/1915/1917 synthase|uniref:Pseudouridine synthase n=2 Tax=Alteromonadales TaxID=135622 RepID=A0A125BEC2_SHEFR|nr:MULTISPECIES: 23S rRNA pseudouridine(1911/1915/1917) synthase RluD [Shewanella]KVX01373.1 23S rRNA pseudouridylate synthase [Shewanella frigidimarina]MBB1360771.1 23S rRNA pseudouridine(1911/1915/1917) synthase RluD [Shewanella sp. SR44-4]MBB1428389.1 23S rRNA pseudouridine(1911/1915/1917) synthase RluD [Shewanella sp. SG44-2]MBO1898203.1 23S rRNA pseudouridine(1911/1915/1917) synthase RluD [Shewanella sp. BF02_Schw]PKH34866.1 23S rRNA pseudouridine(1911/1915/1917) synthase RluD [Shewanella
MTQEINLKSEITATQTGLRLDQALAGLFPDYSRTRIKEWILSGAITIDGITVDKPREKVFESQLIEVTATLEEEVSAKAQNIDLNIIYEDDHIIVINKQAGLVVHPGAGNADGTLMNALLYHCPDIEHVPRAGIVHRLDKDTTGLMVVAKTVEAQTHLVAALQARDIVREYEAIVLGTMTAGGTVDEPIERHATRRTQMAVIHGGRPSVTHYRVSEKFRAHTRLRLRLESGRTHQIRVHMAHIGHELVGDPVYGGRPRPPKSASPEFFELLKNFKRQALHAVRLELAHPFTCEIMTWHAPIPDDMVELTKALRVDTELNPIVYL